MRRLRSILAIIPLLAGLVATTPTPAQAATGCLSVSVAPAPKTQFPVVSWRLDNPTGAAVSLSYSVQASSYLFGSPQSGNVTLGSTPTSYLRTLQEAGTQTFTVTSASCGAVNPVSYTNSELTPAAQLGGTFNPIVPTRIMDTRSGLGGSTTLGPGATTKLVVSGTSVPTSAKAVVLNVTATDTTDSGYLTIWPAGGTMPLASSVNFLAGGTVPNLVVTALGSGGAVNVFNSNGTTDVIVDVAGYYAPSTSAAGLYNPVSPSRVMDTRSGQGGHTPGVGETRNLLVAGAAGIPSTGATAVTLNVTVTNPTASSFLTVWPTGSPQPTASNLNFVPGQTVPNRVTVKLGTGGMISFYNLAGTVDVIADANGWFSDGVTQTSGSFFWGLFPWRYWDSRVYGGTLGSDPSNDIFSSFMVGGATGIPKAAKALVLNVTATNPTSSGFLTVYPGTTTPFPPPPPPTASDLNFVAGQTVPNLTVTKVGPTGGQVNVYNFAGSTDFILDVTGWFM